MHGKCAEPHVPDRAGSPGGLEPAGTEGDSPTRESKGEKRMDKALREHSATQRRAGSKLDWRRKMSDHVAYGLLVYTGLQIWVTMGTFKSASGSILPYFAL